METRQCQVCRSTDPIFVHTTPYGGDFTFLCTPCVLRHHPASFCPICFAVYDDSLHDNRIMCHRCPAMAHLTCLSPTRSSSTFRYLCPHCSDSAASSSDAIEFANDFAKKLLCAAKLAALFMHRASAIAKSDAERKVKAALLARQKASEAIERAGNLMVNRRPEDESELEQCETSISERKKQGKFENKLKSKKKKRKYLKSEKKRTRNPKERDDV